MSLIEKTDQFFGNKLEINYPGVSVNIEVVTRGCNVLVVVDLGVGVVVGRDAVEVDVLDEVVFMPVVYS